MWQAIWKATPRAQTAFRVLASVIACLTINAAQAQSPDRGPAEAPAQNRGKSPAVTSEHPLIPALRLARSSQQALASVKDYEATFSKIEKVGRRVYEQSMALKLREEPFSVYLRFLKPHTGREVIYIEGQNNGNILAHDTGLKALVGTVSLKPTEPRAMEENRYAITTIGMRKMVKKVIEQWEFETQYGECEVKYYPDAKLGELNCRVVESSHPAPRKEFKFHITRLFLDKKTSFPVRVEQYGFPTKPAMPPPLVEQYTYSNLRLNINLADLDFDIRHPDYDFAE